MFYPRQRFLLKPENKQEVAAKFSFRTSYFCVLEAIGEKRR